MTLRCSALVAALVLGLTQMNSFAQEPASVPYVWKPVVMHGGGFVDGIVFHPTEKGLRYCRTDIGGAYRWDDDAKKWVPILDWLSYEDANLMGVESIALDPNDPDRVYLACGTYTNPTTPNGAILRSDDRGKTFQRTNMPFKMGGNEDGRGNGERMAVDPNDSNILYFGSRNDGLWRSTDRGVTWDRVDSFPDVTEAPPPPPPTMPATTQAGGRRRFTPRPAGIVCVLFDARGSHSTIYVAASLMNRENFYRSTDAGKTWHAVPDAPTNLRPTHAVLASDGMLYITYGDRPGPSRMRDGAVWKFDTTSGQWTDITPDKPDPADDRRAFGYAAVAVDAQNPQALIVSSFFRGDGEEIFRSTDGGGTWRPIVKNASYDYSLAPYAKSTVMHWFFDIEIDPVDPNHAMMTSGYGGWETFNLTDADAPKPINWSVSSAGIEETVVLEFLSPAKGPQVVTAIGDYGGFVHWDLDKPSPEGNFTNPKMGNTTSVAGAALNPDVMVRVGRGAGRDEKPIGFSLDGGKTWQPAAALPAESANLGRVAVSADGGTWIWTPQAARGNVWAAPQPDHPPYLTRDRGVTWTACQGVPNGTRIVADHVNSQEFYGIALFDGKLFTSTDGGANFAEQPLNLPGELPKREGNRGDNRGGQDRLYTTPAKEGDLWIAAFEGLYHSADSGAHFTKLGGVEQIHAFGFGKGADGASDPALYLVGVVNGVRGIFRSDDSAASWLRINDDAHQWGLVLQISGDPKKYGRVYVGTHGRGALYGDQE